METGKQTASTEAWEAIGAPEQVEIITRAAKRAIYIAGAYGVVLTVDEIMGATWRAQSSGWTLTGWTRPMPRGRQRASSP